MGSYTFMSPYCYDEHEYLLAMSWQTENPKTNLKGMSLCHYAVGAFDIQSTFCIMAPY